MIRVPLEEPTWLFKGLGYSIDLRQSDAVPGSTYVAVIRPWSSDDVEPPVIVNQNQLVTEVTLRSIPAT